MLKYDFNNNIGVVDQPSIWKISKDEISITHASGTDHATIPNEGYITVQVGNVEPIKPLPGTSQSGYNKEVVIIGYEANTLQESNVHLYVNNVSVEKISEETWSSYTKGDGYICFYAKEENPSNRPRYTYYKIKTSNDVLNSNAGTSEGLPVMKEWYITVMQEENPNAEQHQNIPSETIPDGSESGSGSGSSSGGDNPSQGGSDNPGGSGSSDTPTGEAELVYGTTTGDVNMSIILNNTSNEDIYITGHMYIAVRTQDDSDWAPIHINIDPYSHGCALYYVPANTSVTIPSNKLDIFVNKHAEPVSKYYGGHIFYFSPGDPVYWRVYSWTNAHDPAVVKSTPGNFNFTNGGSIEFVLNRTDEAKEGRITRSTNPINLATW